MDEDKWDDWLQSHKKAVAEMIEEMAWTYREYAESRKPRFGKKFNENDEIRDAVNDAYDKYRACSTVPKVCQAIKINDDGTEQKTSIWMDRGNSIGGIAKAIKDGRLRKVLKFSESSKKFVKESTAGLKDLIEAIYDDVFEIGDGTKAPTLLSQLEAKLNELGLLEDESVKDDFDDFADVIKICLKSSRIQNFYRNTAWSLVRGLKDSIDSAKKMRRSRKPRFVKESTGEFVEVSAIVKGRGQTIEEAIENFDSEIGVMSSDQWDTWADNFDGKDREYWIDEYNKWQEENGGDVDLTVIDDKDNAQGYYGLVTISNTDEY